MSTKNIIFLAIWFVGTAAARPFDYPLCATIFEGIDKRRTTEKIPAHKLKSFFDQWAVSADGLASMAPNPRTRRRWSKKILHVLEPEVDQWFISPEVTAIFQRAQQNLEK